MNQKQNKLPNLNLKGKKLHFIGIGGIGMSALARYFHADGSIISGSDKENSPLIESLKDEGIKNIWTPHLKEKLIEINPDYIIYSTAITNQNEELVWSQENKKDVLHRSELLEIATSQKKLIAVSGTHGKTTTTSIIFEILEKANLNPSCILGGILTRKNTNVVLNKGNYFIAEADESDKSFLKGVPELAIITNIEEDHLENFSGGISEIKTLFTEFAKKALDKMGVIACFEDKNTKEIITRNFDLNNPKLITYGFYQNNDCPFISTQYNQSSDEWKVFIKGKYITSIKPQLNGKHNILNSLAGFAVGYLLGIDNKIIKLAIDNCTGTKRRFEVIGEFNGATIIDDYAHHPTEIRVTIQAAKEKNPKRLVIVLQPHQPRRLQDLWQEFVSVLKTIDDIVLVTDTYIARGTEISGINSKQLVEAISKPNINHLPGSIEEITNHLKNLIKPMDLVLIMGAGNITQVGHTLVSSYEILASKTGNN